MTKQRTIDVHAHVLTEGMMQRMRKEAPAIGPFGGVGAPTIGCPAFGPRNS